jgi:predicted nuclease of predicted toxin-antitoxin system
VTFLIDAQLPPAFARWLGQRGHEVLHVTDVGLLSASDRRIADFAQKHALTLVTKDEDFVLLRLPDRYALVWLRIGNATNRALTAWLEPRWTEVERLLRSGERFVEVR